ncbi:MAG: transporter permease [Rhodospirillales bacterium]|jgi:NitT/TauT family transport system permease protein|nr:transporter permease [Rhodospirillales bacterium]
MSAGKAEELPLAPEVEPALGGMRIAAGVGRMALTLASLVALLALWWLCVTWFKLPPYILPSPLRVANALWSGLAVPLDSQVGFYLPLASTLVNSAIGFVIGAVLGIALGSLMAEFRPIETIVMPYAFALQALPKVAIAPLIVIWCGFGDGSKITMAALLAFFPLMVNTFTGIRTTDPERLALMRALAATRLETYRFVKLPSAAPYIFAGLDMGMVYALLGTLVAEFLGAQSGIGVAITQAQAVSDVASVFAALVLLGLIGIGLHLTISAVEHRVIHWAGRHKN